jgi:ribonuclease HI
MTSQQLPPKPETSANERRAARALAEAQRKQGPLAAPDTWQAWFDGSARPNPGACAIGALLRSPAGKTIEITRTAGYGNSSEAEYRALIAVLEAALHEKPPALAVYGDSQVVIDDVNGPEHAAAQALLPYRSAVHALLAQLGTVTLRWIPRHRNTAADALSQRAGLPATEVPS